MIEYLIQRIEKSRPPITVMSVGIPASGKSTLLREVGLQLDTPPIVLDDIRLSLEERGIRRGLLQGIQSETMRRVAEQIVRGGVALIDATNIERSQRIQDVALYRELGSQTIGAAWMDVGAEYAFARNAQRARPVTTQTISAMHAMLSIQPPTSEEGFDWIVTNAEGRIRTGQAFSDSA